MKEQNNIIQDGPSQLRQNPHQPKPNSDIKKAQQNFIGVPPNLTHSTHRSGQAAEFVDEEEEEEAQNNIVTQAELFKSYAEQNSLYVNQCLNVYWFEYGGKKIGRMNMDIMRINQLKMRAN